VWVADVIVTSKTPEDYELFAEFAEARGMTIPPRYELNVIGALNGEGHLVGVIEFKTFVQRTCAIHTGGTMTPDLIKAAFKYVFRDLGLVHMHSPTRASDTKLLELAQFLGFSELYRVPQGWDEETDLVMLGIHKSQCRWIEEK
jgi:hypothetical protein